MGFGPWLVYLLAGLDRFLGVTSSDSNSEGQWGAGTGSQNSKPISFNTGINHEISVIVTASLQ